MKKIKLSVAALLIASASFAQTQCVSLTKDSLQCKNVTKQGNQCYLHNANYVKPSNNVAVSCNGTTKKGANCKNKTKNTNQLCHLHTKKD
tara:strand:- start:492 stop:761 length:270 start_codon:yes stop_codon:yes gene_type:complete